MGTETYEEAVIVPDQSLLEALPCYVFVQRGAHLVYLNRAVREALGLDDKDILPIENVFHGYYPGLAYANPSNPQIPLHHSREIPHALPSQEFDCELRTASGLSIPIHGSFRVLRTRPEAELLIAAMPSRRDSDFNSSSNFLEHLLDAAPEAIMITRGSRILHVNREFESLFGFTAEEAVGQSTLEMLIPETRRHEYDMLEHTMQMHGRASMETVRLHKSGKLIDVSILVAPIEISGIVVGNFVSYRDIQDKKQTDAKLQYDALHDPLTGLANRALFLDRLQVTMARQQRRSELNYAVLFLDLDRFKSVNDSLGHACGDDLLVKMAERLRNCFRPEDTVARFGGDEFAILIEDVTNVSDVTKIAERAQHDIHLPIEVYGHEVLVSASIGIAFGTLDHVSPEQVLRDADFAMYQAKSHGQARHEVFDSSMHVHAAQQLQKEQDLKDALGRREFEVWYQPIYQLEGGEIEGFEALLRWRRADGVFVPIEDFLPLAEETGLIIPIGSFVLEEVIQQLGRWSESLPGRQPSISVNLSPKQFTHPHLLNTLSRLLTKSKTPSRRLRLEVTEAAINHDPESSASIFQRLAGLGISVALDNFGVGLASMNHFRLPIDLVKVDRRLIEHLPAQGRQAAVVQTIFDLGRLLGVRMLAEGVERIGQVEALRQYGCDLGQGHLFSAAVSAEKARTLLEGGRWRETQA